MAEVALQAGRSEIGGVGVWLDADHMERIIESENPDISLGQCWGMVTSDSNPRCVVIDGRTVAPGDTLEMLPIEIDDLLVVPSFVMGCARQMGVVAVVREPDGFGLMIDRGVFRLEGFDL